MLNALRIFEAVASEQPIGLKRLAELVELPPTTVHRALGTLTTAGWLTSASGTGRRWVVGGRIRRLLEGTDPALVAAASPILRDLRDRCEESVSLAVADGAEMVIIAHFDGARLLRVVHVEGTRAPIHAAATGKAILALLTVDDRQDRLASGLPRYTPTTLVDADSLEADLEVVRSRGWAVMDGEWVEEVSSVGAAVVDAEGKPVAGVGISVPSVRLDRSGADRLGEMVRVAAAAVSSALAGAQGSRWGKAG